MSNDATTSSEFVDKILSTKGTGGFLEPEKIISEFEISDGMRIADFGCGAGYFTILMGKRAGEDGKVYAIDVLQSALDSVAQRAKAEGLRNVEPIWTDLEVPGSTGLNIESMDMVLLANVLFQSVKKANILNEARRVLKQGGKLVIIDWMKGTEGFGPPDSLRTDDVALQSLVTGVGFILERRFTAGRFHFGMIFVKEGAGQHSLNYSNEV